MRGLARFRASLPEQQCRSVGAQLEGLPALTCSAQDCLYSTACMPDRLYAGALGSLQGSPAARAAMMIRNSTELRRH